MSDVVLKIENLSKQYRLGLIGTGTLSHDLNRWWHKVRGKEDPYLKVGDINDRATTSDSGYVWALKDINLEVRNGEVLGIIGKNGAGKSTLLKILSKVTGPTTGSIKIKGRTASLLEVGTGFHPELTGKENIFLNGAILGMTKAEIRRKVDEIVDFSGCARYIDTPVKRYSSGMRVRLAFAVAAFLEPEILIVDEVLAVGDAEFQKKAVGKMKEVSAVGGRTVLFVSHNMKSINELCDRTILLENGEITQDGDSKKIVDYYLYGSQLNRELVNSIVPAEYERPWGRKGCQFLEISLLNSKGELTRELKFKERFSLKVKFLSEISIPEAHLQIRIVKKDGTEVSLSSIYFQENKYLEISLGEHEIISHFDNISLMPDDYCFHLFLFSLNSRIAFDAIKNFHLFSIVAWSDSGRSMILNSKTPMNIFQDLEWEFSQGIKIKEDVFYNA